MGAYLAGYPEFFGDKPVRDIGLVASEGRFTIPIADGTPAGVLDIRHHYFEFIPEDQADSPNPDVVAAVDLIEGQRYFLVPTTAGGLYRYMIHDLVRCVGFEGQAPLVEFLSKGAHFSSLTGEKLSEYQVVLAVNAAQRILGIKLGAYLVLPHWGEPPHYHLLIEETDVPDDPPGAAVGRRGRASASARQPGVREQAVNPPPRPNPSNPRPCRFLGSSFSGGVWRRAGERSNNTNNLASWRTCKRLPRFRPRALGQRWIFDRDRRCT